MFTIYCPQEQAEVLLWPTNVDGLCDTADGIEVRYHCHCGYRGTLLTGRAWERRVQMLASAESPAAL